MTQRRVYARPGGAFVRPSTGDAIRANDRVRQASGVFQSLGALMKQRSDARFDEASREVSADANTKARALAAQYLPELQKQMERPETYEMSAEEFLESDVYKTGSQKIEEGIPYPEHKKKFLAQYQDLALRKFTEGKMRKEQEDRNHTASLAQQGAAQNGGIKAQIAAYEDSLASGVDDDEAFTSGLATAMLQGPQYLKQFASARDWTPEQDLKIQQQLSNVKKEFDMQAAVAYKRAQSVQDRSERYAALQSVMQQHGDSLSNSQKASIYADSEVLREEIASERRVVDNLGRISTEAMANGAGMNGGRRLSIGDIKRLQDQEVYRALQNGDTQRIAQLSALPGDEPDAMKEVFGQVLGSLETADPENPEQVRKFMQYANVISDNLGTARLKAMLGAEDYGLYQEFTGNAKYMGIPKALEQFQQTRQLLANGNLPTPEDWSETRRSIVDYAETELEDFNNPIWSFSTKTMNTASMRSQLEPMFRQWRAMGLTQDQMKKRVDGLIKDSSWGGYLNGGVLGAHVESLTRGDNGNPYGDRSGSDLLEEYRELKLEEVKANNPDVEGIELVIGSDPNTVFLMDTSGIPIANSITSVRDISKYIEENVPTVKERLVDESTKSKEKAEREELEVEALNAKRRAAEQRRKRLREQRMEDLR